jgi:hypothetical protein
MASIFGALGLPDTDYVYVNTVGQSIVYDATNQILGDHREDMQASMAFLVERTTSDHKIRYKLPGSGQMQRVNRQGRPGAVKAINSWDIGLPLEEFAAEIAGDRVTMAYMSMAAYQLHVQTVMRKDQNTVVQEMLKALFNNTERSFVDELWGTLLVEPLANGDAVTYPPLVGNAETAKIQSLANFDPVPNRFVTYGDNVSLVEGYEGSPLPGRVLGETDSALIVEWRRIPAGYLLAVHLDAPKPLLRRIDPPQVGLGDGLQLVAEDLDFPYKTADWSHRFGFGAGNRLNGVVMQLTAGSYTIPTIYA